MKKILLPIIITITTITLLITLFACQNKNQNTNLFSSEIDNISYQALSSIKLLETKAETIKKRNLKTSNTNEEVLEKETIDKYLDLMNELLSTNEKIFTNEKTSDKIEYTHMIEITTKKIQGESSIYLLYYNETKKIIKDEIDEQETITEIKGIAISDNKEYQLIGEIKEEIEDNEKELETYYKIIENENNYVIVKEEFEQEETEYEHEYKYELYQNNIKTNSVSFELEKENNKLKIKLKETKNIKTSYEFKIEEKDNKRYIKIKVFDGTTYKNIKVRVIYDLSINEYIYEYIYLTE